MGQFLVKHEGEATLQDLVGSIVFGTLLVDDVVLVVSRHLIGHHIHLEQVFVIVQLEVGFVKEGVQGGGLWHFRVVENRNGCWRVL